MKRYNQPGRDASEFIPSGGEAGAFRWVDALIQQHIDIYERAQSFSLIEMYYKWIY